MFEYYFYNMLLKFKCRINLFILLLFALFSKKYIYCNIEAKFPKTFLLNNGNIFLANYVGMFICDSKFETILKSHSYVQEVSSFFENSIYNLLIVQYPEPDGIIICLVSSTLYFFDSNGNLTYTNSNLFNGLNYQGSTLNLLAYKKENGYYHYIIAFISNDYTSLNIFHYRTNTLENELIYRKSFVPFYFDFPKINLKSTFISCQIMNSAKKGKVLTCCFQGGTYELMIIQSFIIEKNLEEIGEDTYARIESPDAKYIHSLASRDGKRLLSCYVQQRNSKGYCLIYNIDSNEIISNEPLIQSCQDSYSRNNLFYVNKTNEYAFICSQENQFTIMLMNENFEIINADHYSSYNYYVGSYFNSFNLIYDSNNNKYAFIIDMSNDNYKTTKINVTTDFSGSFPGSDKPDPFPVIQPPQDEYQLPQDNKYYLNVKENIIIGANLGDKIGKVINFLDKRDPILLPKDNKPINKELYSLRLNIGSLRGSLKYIINNEEVEIDTNKRINGALKFKYYPPEQYNVEEHFYFTLFLRNYSIIAQNVDCRIHICIKNCSCSTSYCEGCIDGYKDDLGNQQCRAICQNRFYLNNETLNVTCLNEDINECPTDYPFYNPYTKECKRIIFEDDDEIDTPIDAATQSLTDAVTQSLTDAATQLPTDATTQSLTDAATQLTTDAATQSPSDERTQLHIDLNTVLNDTQNSDNVTVLIINNENIKILEKTEDINKPDKLYSMLSSLIENGNITLSPGDKDILLEGESVIYQITTSDNQKKADLNLDVSIIDLGDCEKIIKRNISYENDPTPLLILKIDIKRPGIKASLVAYEVYNPYTKEKIDLSICNKVKINILSPVNMTTEETELYNDGKSQGYDFYDINDSFYQDICTPFTSKNGTDVILIDRKLNYYNKDASFCENSCDYKGINTEYRKVNCDCEVKKDMDFDNNKFDKEKFLENFYKIEDYTNYQVLFCYKLVFSSKGLKKNIFFYILLFLFAIFFALIIVNLLKALKTIDEIIFKIFQEKFMYKIFQNVIKNKKNQKNKEENDTININGKKPISIFQKLKLKYRNEKNNKNKDNKIDSKENDENKNDNNAKDDNKKDDNNIKDIDNKEKPKSQKNKHIIKIKKRKIFNANLNEKKSLKKRLYNKLNYSNDIRNNNYVFNNIISDIIKKDSKNSLPVLLNNNKDSNDITNSKFDNNKSTKDLYRSPFQKKKITKKRNSFIDFKNALYNSYIFNESCLNNNNIKPNPPKKNNGFINKILNINNNEHNSLSSCSISDKRLFIKTSEKNKLKGKVPNNIYKSNELTREKTSILSNNIGSISFKNEDNFSKKDLLQNSPSLIDNKNYNFYPEKKNEIEKPLSKANNIVKPIYIDAELNRFDYEMALIYDKRKYWQYYISLLKKKHLIILVFISDGDYNVFYLKLSLFIVSVSLFFALNALSYKDSTMRHIYSNKGKYDLLYQIPQVLYSTIFSFIMTFILKNLSLSQMTIIEIKKEKEQKKAKKMADDSKKCFKIKLYFFCFISLFLILFFWYYITAFGAVYPNTQLHLIKDTLMSFGISMIYPFIINLLPGIFRIPALRAEKKDKKWIYQISKIIAYL